MSPILLLMVLTICGLTSLAQTQDEIDNLLAGLSGQSEFITKDSSVVKLLNKGEKLLPTLSKKITDSTTSKVFSKCTGRYLTRGELAIILADHIETMPYFTLTGLQNCMSESCDNNPNFIEYYLEFIRFRGMAKVFQKRYDEWLTSPDRKKYATNKSNN
jgi:hypothetical protein